MMPLPEVVGKLSTGLCPGKPIGQSSTLERFLGLKGIFDGQGFFE